MRLADQSIWIPCLPWNYGDTQSRAASLRHLATVCIMVAGLSLLTSALAIAQQAGQTGFDPRQTEKRFDDVQSDQPQAARHALRMPVIPRPAVAADDKP